jgi:hypothetical protein
MDDPSEVLPAKEWISILRRAVPLACAESPASNIQFRLRALAALWKNIDIHLYAIFTATA